MEPNIHGKKQEGVKTTVFYLTHCRRTVFYLTPYLAHKPPGREPVSTESVLRMRIYTVCVMGIQATLCVSWGHSQG